jgi:hypothetical protein
MKVRLKPTQVEHLEYDGSLPLSVSIIKGFKELQDENTLCCLSRDNVIKLFYVCSLRLFVVGLSVCPLACPSSLV